jgi:predicted TIM-barrel fold metal-dependent hydrolase
LTTAGPAGHQQAMCGVDRYLVITGKHPHAGRTCPPEANAYVARYVREHADRAIGFARVDPGEAAAGHDLEHAIQELGLKGVKLSPVYEQYHPLSDHAWRIYELADRLKIPVMLHQAAASGRLATCEHGSPILFDEVARSLPNLKIIFAHLGQPWVEETVVMLWKHPNVYADLSGVTYHPWELYGALIRAWEYRVHGKLLFGSDFPMTTPAAALEAVQAMARIADGTSFPAIPQDVLDGILYERPFSLLGL